MSSYILLLFNKGMLVFDVKQDVTLTFIVRWLICMTVTHHSPYLVERTIIQFCAIYSETCLRKSVSNLPVQEPLRQVYCQPYLLN